MHTTNRPRPRLIVSGVISHAEASRMLTLGASVIGIALHFSRHRQVPLGHHFAPMALQFTKNWPFHTPLEWGVNDGSDDAVQSVVSMLANGRARPSALRIGSDVSAEAAGPLIIAAREHGIRTTRAFRDTASPFALPLTHAECTALEVSAPAPVPWDRVRQDAGTNRLLTLAGEWDRGSDLRAIIFSANPQFVEVALSDDRPADVLRIMKIVDALRQ